MEIKQYQFKTNINCGGCIAAVKPHLDNMEGIENWNVDTAHSDKTLTVSSSGVTEEAVVQAVEKAGFKIEKNTQ
jgi:copper chaperone